MSTSTTLERDLVSAVVPTYERPELLRRAVRSVLDQTYGSIELVVVDDHSEAPARTALRDLPLDSLAGVQLVRHSENRGVSAARNTGISTASGEYVAFLDDDDRWVDRKIARQVQRFRKADDATGVVYSGITYTTGEKSTVSVPTLSGDVLRDLLIGRSLAPTSTVMVRQRLLKRAGGFDEALPSWNDRDLYIRLSQRCQFEPIPEALTVRFAEHGGDQISRNYETKRDVTYPRFVSKHRPTAACYGRRIERRFLASVSLMLAKSARTNGYYTEARRHFIRSIRWYPLDLEVYVQLLPVLGGRHTYRSAELALGMSRKAGRVIRSALDLQR